MNVTGRNDKLEIIAVLNQDDAAKASAAASAPAAAAAVPSAPSAAPSADPLTALVPAPAALSVWPVPQGKFLDRVHGLVTKFHDAAQHGMQVFPQQKLLFRRLNTQEGTKSPEAIGPKAERLVYDILRQVKRRAVVLYSYSYVLRTNKEWYESDFVVIDSHGIYVLEVKGHTLDTPHMPFAQMDAANQAAAKSGIADKILHGQQQGLRTLNAVLLDNLRAHVLTNPMWAKLWQDAGKPAFYHGAAVLLPNQSKIQFDRDAVTDRLDLDSVAWAEDCSSPSAMEGFLTRWITSIQSSNQRKSGEPPEFDDEQWSLLQRYFTTVTHSVSDIPSMVTGHREEMLVQWTEEQQALLQFCQASPFMAISGFAGTGKTMIAIERARMIAQQFGARKPNEPRKILVMVKMKSLRDLLEATHDGLFGAKGQAYVVCAPSSLEQSTPLRERQEKVLRDGPFDHVLIAELQRFQIGNIENKKDEAWLMKLIQPAKTCWVFFDDNQKNPCFAGFHPSELLTKYRPTAQFEFYSLTQVVRNTQKIFDLAIATYSSAAGKLSPGRPLQLGPMVEWKVPAPGASLVRSLQQSLLAIYVNGGVRRRNIAILCLNGSERDRQWPLVRQDTWILRELQLERDCWDHHTCSAAERSLLCFDSVHNFQGCDRTAVILLLPALSRKDLHTFYIGVTRSTTILHIVCTQDVKTLVDGEQQSAKPVKASSAASSAARPQAAARAAQTGQPTGYSSSRGPSAATAATVSAPVRTESAPAVKRKERAGPAAAAAAPASAASAGDGPNKKQRS
jgi:hypothetical protein